MLSKRYESTEVDRRTWLHMPSGTHWSTSSDTHQLVEIQKETSTQMYTPYPLFFPFSTKRGTYSEIGYLLRPSRGMAEIGLFKATLILNTTNQPSTTRGT